MVEVPDIPQQPQVSLPAQHSALIVVDMQNDFVEPEGTLFVPEASHTVAAIARLLAKARAAGAKVVYTQDWHPENDPEFAIWPRHTVQSTWGAEIVDSLKPLPQETVLRKARYDGFYGTPLEHLLHLWGVRHVVVVGTVANICVLHTAGSAALRWYQVVVPQDGISALTAFDRAAALRQIAFLYQGQISTIDGVSFV